jgi:hypothetical protein
VAPLLTGEFEELADLQMAVIHLVQAVFDAKFGSGRFILKIFSPKNLTILMQNTSFVEP